MTQVDEIQHQSTIQQDQRKQQQASKPFKMNWSFVLCMAFLFLVVLTHTGSVVQTRSGAGQPIVVLPPAAAVPMGGGAHVAANMGAGAGGAAGSGAGVPGAGVALDGGGAPVGVGGGAAGGPGAVAGPGGVGGANQFQPVTWEELYGWMRDVTHDLAQSAQDVLQWVGGEVQALGYRSTEFVHAHPVAVGVAVSAAAATTVYVYGPSALDYALQGTECYEEGSKDFRGILGLDNEAPMSYYSEWLIRIKGVEACRTGTRPHQARLEEAITEQLRQEREKEEREKEERRKQDAAEGEQEDDTHPGYERWDYQATQDAHEKVAAAGQREKQGTMPNMHADDAKAGTLLEGDQEDESETEPAEERGHEDEQAHEQPANASAYQELVEGGRMTRNFLEWLAFTGFLFFFFVAGMFWAATYAYSMLFVVFFMFPQWLEGLSYYKELDLNARAGLLTVIADRDTYEMFLAVRGVSIHLAFIMAGLTALRIWTWVMRMFPAWPAVQDMNSLINQLRNRNSGVAAVFWFVFACLRFCGRTLRRNIWFVVWRVPVWFLFVLLESVSLYHPTFPEEVKKEEAVEKKREGEEGDDGQGEGEIEGEEEEEDEDEEEEE